MYKIKYQKAVKILLISNIFTIIVLLVVIVKEKYPSRIHNTLFPSKKLSSYSDNSFYEYYTITYPLFKGQKNIVLFGNSLTACVDWKDLLNRNDVATRGISGDISSGLLARMNYIIDLKPKICFIEGGINDIKENIPNDTIIKNLTSIIDTFLKCDIKPVITTVTLLAQKYDAENVNEINIQIKHLNQQILNLAKNKRFIVIDLNHYVSNKNFLNSEYVIKDGLHFSDKTYMIWKQEIEKILLQEGI